MRPLEPSQLPDRDRTARRIRVRTAIDPLISETGREAAPAATDSGGTDRPLGWPGDTAQSRSPSTGAFASQSQSGSPRDGRSQRSDELAQSLLLAPLSLKQRERLLTAMHDIERLLTSASVQITAVDPEHPDAQYCLAEYVAELNRRSKRGFDPAVGATALPHELRPPAGEFFVVAHIETSAILVEALSLYRSTGWVEVPAFNTEPFADHWLEKRLTETGSDTLHRRWCETTADTERGSAAELRSRSDGHTQRRGCCATARDARARS